jgi:hypothetical protein
MLNDVCVSSCTDVVFGVLKGRRLGERIELSGTQRRQADNWPPLLAIADEAGATWPELARAAACTLAEAVVATHQVNRPAGPTDAANQPLLWSPLSPETGGGDRESDPDRAQRNRRPTFGQRGPGKPVPGAALGAWRGA